MSVIIELTKVDKIYKQGSKTIKASDNINIKINEGEFIVIIGQSGSGKSTLMQLIGGLDKPTNGQIVIDGKDISKISEAKITGMRRQSIGFVFQNFNLIPTLSAAQNVEAAIMKRSNFDRKKSQAALTSVGLGDRSSHIPSLLSGGEQQRVAIARALVNDPKIILADEPTGNLDSKTGQEIIELIKDLNSERKKTIVLITHSDYVKKYADRVLEIKDGQLSEIGKKKT